MRWKEILTESPKRYLPMFQAIIDLKDLVGDSYAFPDFEHEIRQIEADFKRQDRIIWFLRWYRILILYDIEDHAPSSSEYHFTKLIGKYANEIGSDILSAKRENSTVIRSHDHLVFLANLDVRSVQAVVWDKQLPSEMVETLDDIHREWQETQSQQVDHSGEVFLKIDNDWAWFDLGKSECDVESKAMGHCGNSGGNRDDTILSLRKKMPDGKYRPSLTFILTPEGFLGEMKGRANQKPNEKYHNAIKALLLDPRIVGIDGGGYAPERNFSLDDIDDYEWVEELKEKKPSMMGVEHLYDGWVSSGKPEGKMKDRIESRIRSSLREYGYNGKLMMDREIIRLETHNSIESYLDDYHSYAWHLDNMFHELSDEIERETLMPEAKARGIASAARDDLFLHLFNLILPYDCNYLISDLINDDISQEWEDGRIVLDLGISSYIEAFLTSESESNTFPTYLDEVSEYQDSLEECGVHDLTNSELDKMILSHLDNYEKSSSKPRIPSYLVRDIIEKYKSASSSGSSTVNDYRQGELDL